MRRKAPCRIRISFRRVQGSRATPRAGAWRDRRPPPSVARRLRSIAKRASFGFWAKRFLQPANFGVCGKRMGANRETGVFPFTAPIDCERPATRKFQSLKSQRDDQWRDRKRRSRPTGSRFVVRIVRFNGPVPPTDQDSRKQRTNKRLAFNRRSLSKNGPQDTFPAMRHRSLLFPR